MLQTFAGLDRAAAERLHPRHTSATLAAARERFHWFEQGVCVVHHMFGDQVVKRVREEYPDALITAHLEVPGEMFALGFRAQQAGRGVVGSTSNILDFIARRVDQARSSERLQFVLGTEAGMTTAIARKVQERLRARTERGPEVEIIFPVAAEAIAPTGDLHLPIVPGVAAGDGCSTAGGCATCPYMKMNSLDALLSLIERIERQPNELEAFKPREYHERIDGHSIAELGTRSIVRMREFHAAGELPAELVAALTR
jgi:quinolinate synthase